MARSVSFIHFADPNENLIPRSPQFGVGASRGTIEVDENENSAIRDYLDTLLATSRWSHLRHHFIVQEPSPALALHPPEQLAPAIDLLSELVQLTFVGGFPLVEHVPLGTETSYTVLPHLMLVVA
jgi:hypothetical protein